MEFNKTINKSALLIKAVTGKKNENKTQGNIVTFSFTKEPMCLTKFTRDLSNVLIKNKDKDITFDLGSFLRNYKVNCGFSLATIILSRLGQFCGKLFTLKKSEKKTQINVIYDKKYKDVVFGAYTTAYGFCLAKHYQTLPGNYLGIADFAKEIKKIMPATGNKVVNVKVLTLDDIKREKMGLIEAVNKASDEPAAMVVIEYFNNPKSKNVLAYVGKGVMYDAGGYELKPNRYMDKMNQDMTGAASVFGTMYALASTKQKVNVVGLLPLAKNMINEKSMVVGDVYTAADGKTVEVRSPDSEGRMILADAIVYANKHYRVSKVITIATLTGLSELSFGDYLTPFWATNDKTAKAVLEAGHLSGDGLIRLPLFEELVEQLKKASEIADYVNCVKNNNYSNGSAAAFLKEFCKCPDFAHFDVAGTHVFKNHSISPLGFMLFLFAVNHFKK